MYRLWSKLAAMGTTTIFAPDFLSQLAAATTKSSAGIFWQIVTSLWSSHWLLILVVIVGGAVFEILTWNGTAHYNSRNGFSPTFNRVVGSGTYLLLQTIVYGILHLLFGDSVYLQIWPYAIHAMVFSLTWILLRLSGFWVY